MQLPRRTSTLADQIVSSASNLLVPFLVARSSSPEQFGLFAASFTAAVTVLGISRAYWGSRIALAPDVKASTQASCAALFIAAPVIAGAVFLIGLVASGGPVSQFAVATALAAPFICAQDAARFGSVALGRPQVALLGDAVWLVALLVLVSVGLSGEAVVWAWAASGIASLLVMARLLRLRPRLAEGTKALAVIEPAGLGLAAKAVLGSVMALGLLFLAGRMCGTECVGSLQGSWTMVSPAGLLSALMLLGLTPALRGSSRGRIARVCISIGSASALLVLLWGGLVLLWGDPLGSMLLGETWAGAQPLVPYATASAAAIVFGSAMAVGLRASSAARPIFLSELTGVTVAMGLGLAVLGADAGLSALAAAEAIGAISGALAACAAVLLGARSLTRGLSGGPTPGR